MQPVALRAAPPLDLLVFTAHLPWPMQASLQGLLKLVHPEVTLYDAMGSGPQGTLLHGAQAAGNWLLGRSLK